MSTELVDFLASRCCGDDTKNGKLFEMLEQLLSTANTIANAIEDNNEPLTNEQRQLVSRCLIPINMKMAKLSQQYWNQQPVPEGFSLPSSTHKEWL